jgi:beta-fructofuranosidase
MSIFYKPDDGWAGDFIPFYWDGEYHLFYLKDYRDKDGHGEGTPWFHLSTRDFVSFTDYGEAIPRGTPDEQDLYIYTGCVFEKDGLFHIFYTGHNPHFRGTGKPIQAVMHATSSDLITWEKDPNNPISVADTDRYELDDWRDPFVFWNEDAGEYWLLLAARLPAGPINRRGCVALVASPDLINWEARDPFWAPSLYYTHECPDLFHIGDWWYLVYSTFTERNITHYRMSRSLSGPWLAPTNDSFDGRAFYAAKTASDGQRRFAFAWNPTRTDEKDTGNWNWGGSLVTHEIYQDGNGWLSVKAPHEMLEYFTEVFPLAIRPEIGNWEVGAAGLTAQAGDGFAWCRVGSLPDDKACLFDTTVVIEPGTRSCGVILRADDTLDHYYQVRLEPGRNLVAIDRCPRSGDAPPIIERPVTLALNENIRIQVLLEGSVFVIYISGQVALTARGYEHTTGDCGVFVSEGAAVFSDVGLVGCEQRLTEKR